MDNKKLQNPGLPESRTDEISLIDLLAVLLRYKNMILIISLLAITGVVAFSVLSLMLPPADSPYPNEYTAKTIIGKSSSGLSALLGSVPQGLASMAGLGDASGGGKIASLAVYYITSNELLDETAAKFDLFEYYELKENPKTECRKVLENKLEASINKDSGFLEVSFKDIDPAFAYEVLAFLVEKLEIFFDDMNLDENLLKKKHLEESLTACYKEILTLQEQVQNLEHSASLGGTPSRPVPSIMLETQRLKMELSAQQKIYTELKVQLEMLKVSLASEMPVFQVLEEPEVPEEKSGPSRAKLCIITALAALFISIFLAFARHALYTLRKDPEAITKLKGSTLV